MNQYQIVIVNLDPTIGSEIKKTRPCVVISPDEMNDYLKTVIIAPITSTPKKYPSRVKIGTKDIKGMIALDQLRTIDKKRIVKVGKKVSTKSVLKIKSVLKEMLVE